MIATLVVTALAVIAALAAVRIAAPLVRARVVTALAVVFALAAGSCFVIGCPLVGRLDGALSAAAAVWAIVLARPRGTVAGGSARRLPR